MAVRNNQERLGYTGPEIRTIPVAELLEMIGPAQGFSSGTGITGPADEAFPTQFGPGAGGNLNRS